MRPRDASPARFMMVLAGALAGAVATLAAGAQSGDQGSMRPSEAITLSGLVGASFGAWEDRGSSVFPRGSTPNYSAETRAELRAETSVDTGSAVGELSRCAFEGELSADAASTGTAFALRELWAEWRPIPAFALRAGRQRFGFGSGFAWNPSNDLEPPRDPADPSAARIGADAAMLRIDAGSWASFPLALSIEAIPPALALNAGLSKTKIGAQLYAYAGEIELMAVASASNIGAADFPWLLGGWTTLPLGRLILGLEGSVRRRADLFAPDPSGSPIADTGIYASAAATATLRKGDFVVVGEAFWDAASYSRGEFLRILAAPPPVAASWVPALARPGSVGALHCMGRVSWGSGDLSASCGAIVDADSGALVATGEFAAATGDRASVKLEFSVPAGRAALADDELGLSGVGSSVGASLSVNF